MTLADPKEERVLVLAPTGRDGKATQSVLTRAGIGALVCDDIDGLVTELRAGTGILIIAEEALIERGVEPLVEWIEAQPRWSDLPILMLTSDREAPAIAKARAALISLLRNVSPVERPVQPLTIVSTARAALRARRHQYLVRRHLLEEWLAGQALDVLVAERTKDLACINEQLRKEMVKRAKAEEAQRQSQKLEAIGQLTGSVAHDFNNLLTVICSSVDLLKKQGLAEDRRQRYIGMIGETAERAAKLTAQLLAFARRQPLQVEVFNATERTVRLIDVMTTIVGSRIRIRTEVPSAACWVRADVSQFETALVNMVVNARDAMDGDGSLTVSLRTESVVPAIRGHGAVEGVFVGISVADTGSGIAAEELVRIFEPFFTTKEIGKGTGLGLSQVYGFAKQSGGDVSVTSEVGKGSVFTLYLPRAEQIHAAFELDGNDTDDLPVSGTVLVVEDNNQVGEFAAQLLEDLGYTTARAGDAASALRLIEADPDRFDIVFSDVMMPGAMNGVDLVKALKLRCPGLPVILTTGYSDVLAQAGTDRYELLRKPYSVAALSLMIRKVTRKRPRHSEFEQESTAYTRSSGV